ncbi:MAG: hypothetical protein JSV04_09810 [Candidatus Heimdallarchaeota archaeon]|nr:MAG: hypothetical protein JSV04_09810 [Candidatus Heimdallarchaeota archaeon]
MTTVLRNPSFSPVCPKKPQKSLISRIGVSFNKPILLVLILILLILSTLIGDLFPIPPATTGPFACTFGKDYSDDNAQTLIQTHDGGYALAGITWSYGTGGDMWLIRTDSDGTPLWNHTFGGQKKDFAFALIQTRDGGFGLAGATYSFGVGKSDIWLIKLDNEGSIQWEKTLGGAGDEVASTLLETDDGDFVLTGYTSSYGAGNTDIWLLKTDSKGNLLYSQTFGGTKDDVATAMIQTHDGEFILTGSTSSFGMGNKDVWLLKADKFGSLVWSHTFGGVGRDQAQALVQSSDGYAIAGETRLFSENYRDFWLIKTDFEGNSQWTKTYGGTEREGAETLIHTEDGGYLLVGYSTTNNNTGYSDILIVKTDASGNEEWEERLGGDYHDVASAALETNDGYVLAGITNAPKFLPYYSGGDIWLVKTDKNGQDTFKNGDEFNNTIISVVLVTFTPIILWYSILVTKNRKTTKS